MLSAAFDITDKVIFITGAARGIGKGIAQVLGEAGADIVLNALTNRYVEATAADIAKASGRRVMPLIADVTNRDDVQRAVDTVLQEFGRIDVLINNLGDSVRKSLVALPDKPGEVLTDEELKFVMDVNLTGAILCTRAVGPHMLARRSGKVINISSYTAGKGGGELVVYTIYKTGLVGFTRAQALEWAPYNVQVNAIAPGIFPDPVTSGEEGARRYVELATREAPLGREGQLREVGFLALYLASAASDYMTGQTIFLDGGLSL